MLKCRNVQGALAASLYEPLEGEEQCALQEHLDSCAACLAQYRQLQFLARALPQDPAVFEGNLLPAVRESLRQPAGFFTRPACEGDRHFCLSSRQPAGFFTRPAWAGLSSLFLMILAIIGLFIYVHDGARETPQDRPAVATAAERILEEVNRHLVTEDQAGAMGVLEAALARAKGTADAGPLQLAKANLEFEVFHRYEEAFVAYKKVREQHVDAWTNSDPRIKERFDLLTEARDGGFEALDDIDRARSQGETGLPVLEQVMARYPCREVAREAMKTMAALVDEKGDNVHALETLKTRCTNPMAIAQLDVHLGEQYCTNDRNQARGRALLQNVAGGDYPEPAKMAQDVLAKLGPGE